MNKIDLVSLPAYEFISSSELANDVLTEVESLNFIENVQNSISTHPYKNEKLFAWFQECLDQVHELYYSDKIKLNIVTCWANKTIRNEKHHAHAHPNSVVSGVYYLTDHEGCETSFYIDDPWMKLQNESIFTIGKNSTIHRSFVTNSISPVKGKLILFPSHITHETKPNRKNQLRYSVAFNTFFSGTFFQHEKLPTSGVTTYLELDAKNIYGNVA